MTDFVRVSLPNGHEATLPREYAETADLSVIEGVSATNSRGVPLSATRKNGRRMKPKTSVETEVAKKAATTLSVIPAPSDEPTTGGVAVKPEEAPE